MTNIRYKRIQCKLLLLTCFLLTGMMDLLAQNKDADNLSDKLLQMSSKSNWTMVDTIRLQFDTYHTQGIVKVGDYFFLSSVEVCKKPEMYGGIRDGYDRSTGKGRGHIFKFDKNGKLLDDIIIGEGDVYHPGGIDFDGKYIWIPLTEYRPNSYSIIYRLDTETMEVVKILDYPDSIGAIIRNADNNTLIGMNWDARHFYTWTLDERMKQANNAHISPVELAVENPSGYIAFQDAQYIGNNLMLGSGFKRYKDELNVINLGGWEIIDITDFRLRKQVPIIFKSHLRNISLLNNPCAVESTQTGIRAYFVPDDNQSLLYIYDIEK